MPLRTSPNKDTPWIENGLLHTAQDGVAQITPMGSTLWTTWLESATRFYVKNAEHGNFFCRKETRQRGGTYWFAYRRTDGRAYSIYAGKSSDLSVQTLDMLAERLHQKIDDYKQKRADALHKPSVQVPDS